jgi:hypothetical protein
MFGDILVGLVGILIWMDVAGHTHFTSLCLYIWYMGPCSHFSFLYFDSM